MDLNFEQMLAQHNQEFRESEVYNDWMPDDGEYIVSLIKLDHGTSSKDGVDTIWWRLTGRIEDVQDEKINGREFCVGYFTNKAFGILKGAVNTLSGQEVNDLTDANAILAASIGLVVRGKVKTTTSKKNGKEYTNCNLMEVLNTTPATTSAEEAAQVVSPAGVPEPVEEIPTTVAPGAEIPAEAPLVV